MRSRAARCVAFVIVGMLSVAFRPTPCPAAEKERILAHDVYFSLTDNSPEAKEKLVAACKRDLSDQPGVVWFAAGPLAKELQRDVNDRDFDVALHFVFKTKAAHDQYQKSEKHLKLIEENKKNLKKVRVFDSYVEVSSHEGVALEGDRPANRKKPALPDGAFGFAGMIEGKKGSDGRARSVFLGGYTVTDAELERLKGYTQFQSLFLANAQVTDAALRLGRTDRLVAANMGGMSAAGEGTVLGNFASDAGLLIGTTGFFERK